MRPKQWVAVGVLASMSFAVTAQQASERPNPLDANAAVPAATYKSAFDNYQRVSGEPQPSADKVWRMANDEVAKRRPHTGHGIEPTDAGPPPEKAQAFDHGIHH
jgi:hypothetical protein